MQRKFFVWEWILNCCSALFGPLIFTHTWIQSLVGNTASYEFPKFLSFFIYLFKEQKIPSHPNSKNCPEKTLKVTLLAVTAVSLRNSSRTFIGLNDCILMDWTRKKQMITSHNQRKKIRHCNLVALIDAHFLKNWKFRQPLSVTH